MDDYQTFVGTATHDIKAGDEVLVTLQACHLDGGLVVTDGFDDMPSVEVAFRADWRAVWGPPVQCSRRP